MAQWLPVDVLEDGATREEKHTLAAHNVKKVLFTFSIFDVLCAGSFCYQFVFGQAPSTEPFFEDPWVSHWDKQVAFKILPGVLMVTFAIDVILAVAFMCEIDVVDPRWDDYHTLVHYNYLSNMITLIFLVFQRVAVAFSQTSMFVAVFTVFYLAIRCLKLRPLWMLKVILERSKRHRDEDTKYKELWEYWCDMVSQSLEKTLLKWSCVFALVSFFAIIAAFVYMSATSVPIGVPNPHQGARQMSATNLTAALGLHHNHMPRILSSYCDDSHCNSQDLWYSCGTPHQCPTNTAVVSHQFDPQGGVFTTAVGGGRGASVGAGISLLLGPEMVPIGAIVGGALGSLAGTGSVAYNVYWKHWCSGPEDYDFPMTVKNELWCVH